MEVAFKIVFFISIFAFCIMTVGIFLLIIKILLLFSPEINILGVTMIKSL